MRRVLCGLVISGVLVGCSSSGGDGAPALKQPLPSVPASSAGAMVLDSTSVAPGDEIGLFFPEESPRGVAFSLAPWSGDGWEEVEYYLSSDWSQKSRTPSWWSKQDSAGRGWPDIGIGGPGPDHVVVPDSAWAGPYLLCTENASDQMCAVLTVES